MYMTLCTAQVKQRPQADLVDRTTPARVYRGDGHVAQYIVITQARAKSASAFS